MRTAWALSLIVLTSFDSASGAGWGGCVRASSPTGKVANQLLYRDDEPRLEIVERGRPWSFDGDGGLFRLVSEAHRIHLAAQ